MPTDSKTTRVLECIKVNPGFTFREVADRLNIGTHAASTALSALAARGLLERRKIPGSNGAHAYFAAEPVLYIQPDGGLEELRQQVETLLRWKAEAIARFPDLGADPLVLKARKIVADAWRARPGNEGFAERVLAGQYDDRIEIETTLAALRAAQEA